MNKHEKLGWELSSTNFGQLSKVSDNLATNHTLLSVWIEVLESQCSSQSSTATSSQNVAASIRALYEPLFATAWKWMCATIMKHPSASWCVESEKAACHKNHLNFALMDDFFGFPSRLQQLKDRGRFWSIMTDVIEARVRFLSFIAMLF